MSKRILTREQIEELLKNENVQRCSERSITYTKDFKITAVKLYEQGSTSREVFEKAGFNINLLGREKQNDCLRRWNKIIRRKGLRGLSEARGKNGTGRPKKIIDKSDEDKIKRLETEVAYLKAENDFLAKLRAKRAE